MEAVLFFDLFLILVIYNEKVVLEEKFLYNIYEVKAC